MPVRCGTCRFWGRLRRTNGETEVQEGEWRQCGRAAHDKDHDCEPEQEILDLNGNWVNGVAVHDEYSLRKMNSPLRRELAVVQDGSGYYAALKCRADFGCVLHEPL